MRFPPWWGSGYFLELHIAADNFIPIMELQAVNGCSDVSVYTRNPKMFQRFPGI